MMKAKNEAVLNWRSLDLCAYVLSTLQCAGSKLPYRLPQKQSLYFCWGKKKKKPDFQLDLTDTFHLSQQKQDCG